MTVNTKHKAIWQVHYRGSTKQPLPTSSQDPAPPVLGAPPHPPSFRSPISERYSRPLAIEQLMDRVILCFG